ncbi:hypothetical protein IWZ01DRAFT_505018 [Phyllosticta capitalensis]
MQATLRVVSTPTADTPSTVVVLNCDDKQYMIGNMGEAVQRTMNELGVRLVKTHDFFLTGRSEWRNLGGLLGMALTKADQVIASNQDKNSKNLEKITLNVFGPPNLNYTIATTRRIIFKRGMPLNTLEIRDDPPRGEDQEILHTFADDNLKLYPMSISPQDKQSSPASSTSRRRKRSHDEMNDVQTSPPKSPESPPSDPKQTVDQVARKVVTDMFNSTWSKDAFFESKLSEVKLPAKVFWRAPGSDKVEPFDWSAAPQDPVVLVREPWPATQVKWLPDVERAPQAVSYLIKTCDMRGKFDKAKAEELKVPKGKIRGVLAQGQSIQLESGETITPEMVIGPTRVGLAFGVIDLPTADYVGPLISRSEWQMPEIKDNLKLIVWILGPNVASDPALKSFMESLPDVKHLVSSQDLSSNPIMFKKSAGSLLRLSKADEKRFRVPFEGTPILTQSGVGSPKREKSITLPGNAEPIKLCDEYLLKPTFKLHEVNPNNNGPAFNPEVALQKLNGDVIEASSKAKSKIAESASELREWWEKMPCPEAEVIPLGTGSALPSLYRNVSATLIRVPGYGSYLLDCGEGTLGQLQRAFSPSEFLEVMDELRLIYLSHSHADHILGTISVVKAWYNVVHKGQRSNNNFRKALSDAIKYPANAIASRRLGLVASKPLHDWFREYSGVEDFGYSQTWPVFARGGELELVAEKSSGGMMPLVPKSRYEHLFGLQDIQTCFVRHCQNAQAVSLTWPESTRVDHSYYGSKPFKVSYSGDCRPDYVKFPAIGMHSTLLIHEATFEDGLIKDAKAKRHSTTSEALGVGARMRAKCVLLTHFSQRYQKLPVMVREPRENDGEPIADEPIVEEPSDNVVAATTEEHDEDAMDVDPEAYDVPPEANDFFGDLDAMDGFVAPAVNTKPRKLPQAGYVEMVKAAGGLVLPKEIARAADPDDPSSTKIIIGGDMRVGFASDLMRIKMGEFAELEYFVPAMEKLFAEDASEEAAVEKGGEAEEKADEVENKAKKGGDKQKQQKQKQKNKNKAQPEAQEN